MSSCWITHRRKLHFNKSMECYLAQVLRLPFCYNSLYNKIYRFLLKHFTLLQLFYITHDIWKLWWTFLDKVQKYSNFKLFSLIVRQKKLKNMVMWYTLPFQMHKFYSNFGTFDIIMWLNILFETNNHSNCHDFNLDVQPSPSIDNVSFMGWRKHDASFQVSIVKGAKLWM
jgi:RsiW-degrading membrane proteinase PrsW (M82 family)